jgi:methylmalonyl-CoA/ethylmalonyl-CoA epimerase
MLLPAMHTRGIQMKIKRIEHVAIAVHNAHEIAAILQQKLGLTLEYIEDQPEHQTRIAMFPVGESYIELLEGLAPSTETSQWVATKGQSIYHICFEVDDIDGALAELKAKGVKLVNDEPMIGHGNCRVAFIDPGSTGNILFELAEMPKGGPSHAS